MSTTTLDRRREHRADTEAAHQQRVRDLIDFAREYPHPAVCAELVVCGEDAAILAGHLPLLDPDARLAVLEDLMRIVAENDDQYHPDQDTAYDRLHEVARDALAANDRRVGA